MLLQKGHFMCVLRHVHLFLSLWSFCRFSSTKQSQSDSHSKCQELGGQLIQPRNIDENNQLANASRVAFGNVQIWLDMNDDHSEGKHSQNEKNTEFVKDKRQVFYFDNLSPKRGRWNYIANVLFVKIADVHLRSQSQDNL